MGAFLSLLEPIGGYMPLFLEKGKGYYPDLIALNTGRNALEYILKLKKYDTVYLPYFTCNVLLEPIKKLRISYVFYKIDEQLDPIIDFKLDSNACLLYTNYFGIKSKTVAKLAKSVKNLIVDNAQAFFAKPLKNVDTFYSCRKFFGVADGAYLAINMVDKLSLPTDSSADRCAHLFKSLDSGIESAFNDYMVNNRLLCNNQLKKMSVLTTKMMAAINYRQSRQIRKQNFRYLHKRLKHINELKISCAGADVAMVYPFLYSATKLKAQLITEKIFVATYWPNVLDWADKNSWEAHLTKNLIALPIDWRYSLNDMDNMLNILISLI